MNLLFLSRWYPYPPSNGSKLRIFNLLRGLGEHHDVTLISILDQANVAPDIATMQRYCSQVYVTPWRPFSPHSKRAKAGFLSTKPRSVVDTFSPALQQQIEKTLAKRTYDVIIASQFDTAVYSESFRGTPALFEEVELGVLYERYLHARTPLQKLRTGLTWLKHRAYLVRLLRNFQHCTVVSEQEQRLVSTITHDTQHITIIPNGVDFESYQGVKYTPQPNTLIFTGSFRFVPNYEAMLWFLRHVHPIVQSQIPEIRLLITGDHDNRPLPPARNVERTGFVDDIRPLIAQSWLSIVPIQSGGGTRLKVLEAMALGTPVVATSKGAEGLNVEDGVHLLVADTPQAFAQAVIRLFKEQGLRQQLCTNAYKLIRERYDWRVIMPQFLQLIEKVAEMDAIPSARSLSR